jgi:YegS/Rv2252/BmrU family lipid kinase
MPPGFLVIANASAGSADDDSLAAAVARLAEAGPVEVARTGSDDELDGALGHAADRLVVAAGGDGTIHAVVARLRALDLLGSAPVGLVPLGTGNDLARGVGIPLDPVEAADLIGSGQRARPVDLLVDDAGGVVVNAAHAGLGAEAAERASDLKGSLGPLAYPIGALIAGVRESGWQLEVVVDGATVHEGPALMVGVGNGSSIGGGTELFPGAAVDDGQADVVVVAAVGAGARAGFARALRSGGHVARDDVWAGRGGEVVVQGDAVRHNADGEVGDALARRSYRLEPGAWRLVRPDAAPQPA